MEMETAGSDSNGATVAADYQVQLDDGRILGLSKSQQVLVYDETQRPPFARKNGSEVSVGDQLLNISDDMRNDIEVYMDLASQFKNEDFVRRYHQNVLTKLQQKFPSDTQTQLVQDVLNAIKLDFPDIHDITEYKVRYWVTVDKEIDHSVEDLRSHAPQSKEDFDRFMSVLNIDQQIADLYWSLGISSLRNDRRYEGRQATLVYQRFLLDTDSVSELLDIPDSDRSRLLFQARSSVFEVVDRRECK